MRSLSLFRSGEQFQSARYNLKNTLSSSPWIGVSYGLAPNLDIWLLALSLRYSKIRLHRGKEPFHRRSRRRRLLNHTPVSIFLKAGHTVRNSRWSYRSVMGRALKFTSRKNLSVIAFKISIGVWLRRRRRLDRLWKGFFPAVKSYLTITEERAPKVQMSKLGLNHMKLYPRARGERVFQVRIEQIGTVHPAEQGKTSHR